MPFLLRTLVLLLLLPAITAPGWAEEAIDDFQADIRVAADGTLHVTERITVVTETGRPRHGIFQDFFLLFRKADGTVGQSGFKVRGAQLDGKPVPWFTRTPRPGLLRVFIGDKKFRLPPGRHTFTLTFDTWRQIRFFDKRDELVWNVTGSYWAIPIRHARVVVQLPKKAPILATAVFTGKHREKSRNARVLMASGGVFEAETLKPLAPREGFTIAIAFPKNVVAEPPRWRRMLWQVQDMAGPLWLLAGAGTLFAFFVLAWYRHGRDPAPGAIFPRWQPPEGISPAMAHWLTAEASQAGPSVRRAFIAALVSLAVKGFVDIERKGQLVLLRRKRSSDASLPPGEQVIMRSLFGFSNSFVIGPSNGERLRKTLQEFSRTIEEEIEENWLRKNRRHFVVGLGLAALTIAGLVALASVNAASAEAIMFIAFFLFIPAFFTTLLVIKIWRRRGWKRWLLALPLALVLIVSVIVVGMLFQSLLDDALHLPTGWQWAVFVAAVALPASLLALWYLLPRPTVAGRQMLDALEGMAMFINVAERPRLNRRRLKKAPRMSPELFEKLLPWAIALGLEKPWTEAFQNWLSNAAAAGAASTLTWHPAWYQGRLDEIFDIDADQGLVGGLDTSITNSIPTPDASTSAFDAGGGGVDSGGGSAGGGLW